MRGSNKFPKKGLIGNALIIPDGKGAVLCDEMPSARVVTKNKQEDWTKKNPPRSLTCV